MDFLQIDHFMDINVYSKLIKSVAMHIFEIICHQSVKVHVILFRVAVFICSIKSMYALLEDICLVILSLLVMCAGVCSTSRELLMGQIK